MSVMSKYLTDGPIDDKTIIGIISDDNHDLLAGASSVFLGRVRADSENNRIVTAIEYSAYPEMVDARGDEIVKAILSSYPDVHTVTILHSTGIVRAGEISLIINVSAGHRDEATRACRDTLEKVKEMFPVWKKEFFDDSSSAWKEN